MSGRIAAAFRGAAAEDRAAFVAYLTAGYPSEEEFLSTARTVLEHADLLEVGMPFSDPLGDGPTIQRAGEAALAGGTTTESALALVAQLREETDKPLVLMTYYNLIYCHPGSDAGFVMAAKQAGADGVILPDLPPEEGADLITAARAAELDTVFLVAPTSTPERLATVGAASRGFVYAVSVTGVTGARAQLPAHVSGLVRAAQAASSLPVAVGFGVSSRESAAEVASFADGVVVGSALIDAVTHGRDLNALAASLAAGVREGRRS